MELRTHDKLNILFGRQGSSRICNPYESFEFLNHMKNTGSQTCDDCLPDCETTIYKTHITTSSYRRCCPLLFKLVLYYPAYFFLIKYWRCDNKNLGLSDLCTFEDWGIDPPIWGHDVREEERVDEKEIPEYIKKKFMSNIR